MAPKLLYFDVPGRAEPARLMFAVGKIPFEDVTFDHSKWPEYKTKTPFGQVPVLELDNGRQLAQSGAINRYVAKLAGLYPKDEVAAAFSEQWSFCVIEMADEIGPTMRLTDSEAKVKARQELLAGKLGQKLKTLDEHLVNSKYVAGDDLTFADIEAFVLLGWFKSGVLDGIPKEVLDKYPSIKAWYKRIAGIDAIKAKYADATGSRAAYRLDQAE